MKCSAISGLTKQPNIPLFMIERGKKKKKNLQIACGTIVH